MNTSAPTVLELPAPDGAILKFSLQTSSVLHPLLAEKYPGIKTWKGTCLSHPALQLRCEWGPDGFRAMVSGAGNSDFLIEPLQGSKEVYRVVPKSAFSVKSSWNCFTEGKNTVALLPSAKSNAVIRTYRLALACTGEFAAYYGGTKEGALSAMATLVNRINSIFERDLGVHLQLVANNDDLIFLNPESDPFFNSISQNVLGQIQKACNQYIGTENYDVGHLLTTAAGGLAYLKSVCSSKKAGGVSGSINPVGDAFIVDYVAHELGHQFGASHTQNNNCNRNNATAVEPGSGSTIMGYAGVCTPNVQAHSDAYFHSISIAEIQNYLEQYGDCASITPITELLTANAGKDLVIPANTPFVLSGEAQYSGEPINITFTWEQVDNELAMMPPLADNPAGPAFRSVFPSENAMRFFPSLNVLINGADDTWEVLPTSERTLNFWFCARASNGMLDCDDKKILVSKAAGPFQLTYPQGGEVWESGQVKTIVWEVAGTDQPPINCKTVDILLSLDGGKSFSYTLVNDAPNNGSCTLVVPPYSSNSAYLMVRASDNVFFDVTRQALTLKASSHSGLTFEVEHPKCHGQASGRLTALYAGTSGTLLYTWSNGATTQTIQNLSAGQYSVTITDGPNTIVGSAEIIEPEPLEVYTIKLPGTSGGSSLLANPTGGTEPYMYHWSNGATNRLVYDLIPGEYWLTVTDANGCSSTSMTKVLPEMPAQMEFGICTANEQWKKIQLQHSYTDMVVVATPIAEGPNIPSVVSRLRRCEGNSFELKLQVAGSEDSPTGNWKVSWIAVESGVYNYQDYGLKFEAGKVNSASTSHAGHWLTNEISFGQPYANPVVLSQVMSYNDDRWSVAWSSAADDARIPAVNQSFSVGKHIGEDNPYPAREDETIGYLVFEAGVYTSDGLRLLAANGAPLVQGISDDERGFEYHLEGFRSAEAVALGVAGMASDEGAWPILADHFADGKHLRCWMAEDQVADAERNHAPESVAMLVIGEAEETSELPKQQIHDNASISLYPNPANNFVEISFKQMEFVGPHLQLTDMFGRVLFSQVLLPEQPGMRQVTLPINTLTEGQYFVSIREAFHVHFGKLLVSRP